MKESNRKDNDPSVAAVRHLANSIVKIMAKTNITPNQITVLNFVIIVPAVLYCLLQKDYIYNIFALLFIFVYSLIDLVDGVLARTKSLQSKIGQWLDCSLGIIYQNLIFYVVILRVARYAGTWQWMIPGMFVLFGQNMAHYMGYRYEKDFGFDAYLGSEGFNKMFIDIKNLSILDVFLKNIIVPSNFIFISIFCCRYLLVLGLLFNRLDLFIIAFGATINIRWISMHVLYTLYLSGNKTGLQTVSILRKIKNPDFHFSTKR